MIKPNRVPRFNRTRLAEPDIAARRRARRSGQESARQQRKRIKAERRQGQA